MAEPKEDAFLDDPEMMEEEFDLDAAMEEEPEAAPKSGRATVEAIVAERDEIHDRLMRALAEAENVRKRAARDKVEAEQYGSSRLARDMLPIYDNLRRALDAAGEAEDGVIEGVKLTLKEVLNVFNKHGVTLIAPEVGDKFDPQIHQAMFEAPLPGTKAGEIIQIAAEGFMLHDRLLRPAQVGVSSTPV
ncbi:MAG: nucleotide exchange factor GrpE [Jannaschia helgolandensis]|jgi:molecular chaperone GrpE|uniref:Protein GrpE n=1 Tax=Jannaschia helgolandensis TaxID=188906 RepID=A0A1H7GYP9_9RHOB|nr:nucleotide exchange factor GrpE [Jannaschia helgolandensis]SEK41025.1 molecular chaperone GrpE [Jannaschia helgolandensis]|tara:strand:- start:264 stop:830 length:567 start_codon:yes stop_codon:yes gene_type:complete